LHRLSLGIPRVINVACDRALLGAYTQETKKISASLVRQAAGEVYGRRFFPTWLGWLIGSLALAAVAGTLFLGWQFWRHQSPVLSAARAIKSTAATHAPMPKPAVVSPPAAPALAVPAAPKLASVNALLEANEANTTDAAAFRRLLALWGTAMSDDRDPCGQAAKAGLACLDQRGSWNQVKTLNRPAILTLTDEHGQRHRVVLSSLDEKTATLNLGEHNEKVSIDDLSRDWFGEFTVVWKPKTARTRLLSVGMQGDEVRWLRRSLSALGGMASDPEHADVYDQELAIAVQNFQREHRLNVDGIAGVQTQVVLDTALADPNSPLLSNALRGG
jgi:general secretion pathway protein A